MTEQEAAAYAERLTRVWGCINLVWHETSGRGVLTFFGQTEEEQLEINVRSPHIRPTLNNLIVYLANYQLGTTLRYFSNGREIDFDMPESLYHWGNDKLPFFSRSCWLSGANVEVTAHERAEWMQGVTKEELEAWNLTL